MIEIVQVTVFKRAYVETVVMGLLAVVRTAMETVVAVVAGRVTKKAVLQRLVALLVPLEMPNHLLLLHEHLHGTLDAVKVLPKTT